MNSALQGGPEANEALARIGDLLRTQDNRITNAPIFVVQQKRRIYGISREYTDDFEVITGDYGPTRRVGYLDTWEFVTACFTEQGCKDYIALNGHNLKEPRIYAEGSFRNHEWRAVRDYLMSVEADTPSEVANG